MQVIVVFDDLDSNFGSVKLKPKGGPGGHNGMRSIIERLGNTHAFPRVKVGIGRPPEYATVVSHVLGNFENEQQEQLREMIEDSVNVLESICALGLAMAISGKRISRSSIARSG
jgi:peptidyl-tRNA hydrolase, PTH1 family